MKRDEGKCHEMREEGHHHDPQLTQFLKITATLSTKIDLEHF
jgi:hypothetical protein